MVTGIEVPTRGWVGAQHIHCATPYSHTIGILGQHQLRPESNWSPGVRLPSGQPVPWGDRGEQAGNVQGMKGKAGVFLAPRS